MGDSSDVPKPTVVITGFGPFGNHIINSSSESVRELATSWHPPDIHLVAIPDIDVEYDNIAAKIPDLWDKHKPTLMVHVGLSGIAKQLTLEQLAHNDGYDKPDNKKCTPATQYCVIGARPTIFSGLDMVRVCDAVNRREVGVDAVISHDPGRYLCDYIYYTSLNIDHRCTAFIHVPPLDKPYGKQKLALGIKEAILAMLQQLECK